MKAIISELWNTGIDIITTDNNEITSFTDLKKCENVIVGDRKKGVPSYIPREVLIDDQIVYVTFRTATHPTGFGKLKVCEIHP